MISTNFSKTIPKIPTNSLGYLYDIEANGFYFGADKIWVIWLKDLENPELSLELRPFNDPDAREKFLAWHNQYDNPVVAGHYILGYDQFMMMKHLDIDFTVGPDSILGKPCVFIDTLYLSQCLFPDRQGHGLEAYGEFFSFEKIDYHQWCKDNEVIPRNAKKGEEFLVWNPHMSVYCERDTEVNLKLFWYLFDTFCEYYNIRDRKDLPGHFKCGQKSWFLMSCQAYTGWWFNKEEALLLVPKIEAMMKEIEDYVLPKLPTRPLKKGEEKYYSMPAKPIKKDQTLSSVMEKWIEKHNAELSFDGQYVTAYGKEYLIEPNKLLDIELPMEMKDSDELKDWFRRQGWKPTFWNFKRDSNGKLLRDDKGKLIPTSPKIQEQGTICPNLEKLEGDLPKRIVKWLSLKNRLNILKGWIDNPRLEMDGRLEAGRSGITPTHRQKHTVVVNVPKASDKVLLGKEFRALFGAEGDKKLAAADASGLEGRVEGHYTAKIDGGARASEILDGDSHSRMAKIFYPEETKNFDINSSDFDKNDPGFKPYRDKSKNGAYCLAYGGSAKKLAETLGKPEKDADKYFKAYWDNNPSLKKLKENVEKFWNGTGQKKWLLGIDGRRLTTRKKSALINTLFQSCGAIIMDYSLCLMDKKLGGINWDKAGKPYYLYKGYEIRRVGYHHDEATWECDEEIAPEIARLMAGAIKKAGQSLKLRVPLEGDGAVGNNWKEIH